MTAGGGWRRTAIKRVRQRRERARPAASTTRSGTSAPRLIASRVPCSPPAHPRQPGSGRSPVEARVASRSRLSLRTAAMRSGGDAARGQRRSLSPLVEPLGLAARNPGQPVRAQALTQLELRRADPSRQQIGYTPLQGRARRRDRCALQQHGDRRVATVMGVPMHVDAARGQVDDPVLGHAGLPRRPSPWCGPRAGSSWRSPRRAAYRWPSGGRASSHGAAPEPPALGLVTAPPMRTQDRAAGTRRGRSPQNSANLPAFPPSCDLLRR